MIEAEALRREQFLAAKKYLKETGTIDAFWLETRRLKVEGHENARVTIDYPPDHPTDAHEQAYLAQAILTVWDREGSNGARYHWNNAHCGVVARPNGSYALDFKRRLSLVDPGTDDLSAIFREVSWQPDLWTKSYNRSVLAERSMDVVCVPLMISALILDATKATGSAITRTAITSYRTLARYWPV